MPSSLLALTRLPTSSVHPWRSTEECSRANFRSAARWNFLDQKQERNFYEDYFDWRKRKDRRTGSKGIGGCWPRDRQGRAQIWRFSSRDREPRECQEALSS